MSDYKLVPVEPTLDMLCAGLEVYGLEDCAEADVLGIFKAMLAAAPAVQGEPVYLYRRRGLHDFFMTCNYDRYAELSAKPHLFETKVLYTAPQPAEQQPAPDVAGLVEALEYAIETLDDCDMNLFHNVIEVGRAALAAHRKKGVKHDSQ